MSESEEVFWKEAMLRRRRGQLGEVSKAATGWSLLFASVIGLFGTVTISGGSDALSALPEKYRLAVQVAISSILVLTATATLLAGLAASSQLQVTNDSTWDGLRDTEKVRARQAYNRLQLSKRIGATAAAVAVTLSIALLFIPSDAPVSPDELVVVPGSSSSACVIVLPGIGGKSASGSVDVARLCAK